MHVRMLSASRKLLAHGWASRRQERVKVTVKRSCAACLSCPWSSCGAVAGMIVRGNSATLHWRAKSAVTAQQLSVRPGADGRLSR